MHPSRRAFLKRSLAAAGLLAVAPPDAPAAISAVGARLSARGRLREIAVHGVHAYADRESVAPGGTLRFHISSEFPCHASVHRLGNRVDDPGSDRLIKDFGSLPYRPQPIRPGSYVHIDKGLKRGPSAFTVEAWVRPWRVDRLMGVVSQEDKTTSEGWALGIGDGGYIGFYLGDGHSEDEALVHRTAAGAVRRATWHHLVARWNGRVKEVWIDGVRWGQWDFEGPLLTGPHPIRLGAMGENGATGYLLDGDLAMVVLRDRCLSGEELAVRFTQRGLQPATGPDVLACWPFDEESGNRVDDDSGHRRHGRIINQGTWMIGGPSFDASIPRFGEYEPSRDPERGHALRLASDDLYDCEWEPVLDWKVPAETASGLYVLRLEWEQDGRAYMHHATFIVKRRARRQPAPILLLAATHTWRAYNAAPFGTPVPGPRQVCGTDGLPNAAGDPPAYSFYRGHAAGQGSYQVGLRVPWPAANPYLRYGDVTDYSHLARADRFTQTWLEREGYGYDMIADSDLHRDPGQLRHYRVFIINGHSEYWTIEMYRGLEEYLAAGGRVMVLSGNTLFWRVTYDRTGTILECRKVDAPGNQMPPELRGEAWHSADGRRGGMMRECGFPGWKLIGLETLGWNNQGNPANFGPWIADATDHPIFHSPEETGLKPGDRFGAAEGDRTPMANGHEFDVRLSTLATLAAGPVPPGSVMPSDPPGIRRIANGVIPWSAGGSAFDYFFRPIRPRDDQGGEMIWWERPEGGTVFNAGTIGAGWVLDVDPRWAALLRNVLHRFGASS